MGSNHQGADRAGNPREPARCGQKQPHMRTQARNHTYTTAYTLMHARTRSFPVSPSPKDAVVAQQTQPESSPSEQKQPPADAVVPQVTKPESSPSEKKQPPVLPSPKDAVVPQETKPESSPSEKKKTPAALHTNKVDTDNGVGQKEPVKKQLFEESPLSPSPALPLDALAPQEPVKVNVHHHPVEAPVPVQDPVVEPVKEKLVRTCT